MYKGDDSHYWTTLAPLKPRLTLASYNGTVALTALIVNLKTAVNTVASLNVSIGLAESEREVTRPGLCTKQTTNMQITGC